VVKSDDENARPQPREKEDKGAYYKRAKTPAVYTRPRIKSYIRDSKQAASAD
jgi:hypothetical protein